MDSYRIHKAELKASICRGCLNFYMPNPADLHPLEVKYGVAICPKCRPVTEQEIALWDRVLRKMDWRNHAA